MENPKHNYSGQPDGGSVERKSSLYRLIKLS